MSDEELAKALADTLFPNDQTIARLETLAAELVGASSIVMNGKGWTLTLTGPDGAHGF